MSKSTSSTGFGIGTVLFLIFLILKLCKIIDWSWIWVFAPLWIPLAFLAIVLILAGIVHINQQK